MTVRVDEIMQNQVRNEHNAKLGEQRKQTNDTHVMKERKRETTATKGSVKTEFQIHEVFMLFCWCFITSILFSLVHVLCSMSP